MNTDLQMPNQSSDKEETRSSIPYLEPRVAKLEVGMERLTDDVRDLAGVVRAQGANMEQEIQKLVVAVTQASGPRKTDWSVIISAVLLIMAIGSAVFWPLNQTTQDNKESLRAVHSEMVAHEKMDNHPVGAALVQRLEEQLRTHIVNNDRDFKNHVDSDSKEMAEHVAQATREHQLLNDKFEKEMVSHEKLIDAKIALVESEARGLQAKNDLYIDKLFGRVQILEGERTKMADNEHAELMQWRQKAMGLSSPEAVVPLVKRDSGSFQSPSEKK